ncbi:MAG: SPOR domain-containing protein, partial [Gammaproteobacteria bacterium]
RLVGAAVLVILAVIFIPMLLDDAPDTDNEITRSNIPPKPETNFSSRIIPIPEEEIKAGDLSTKEKITPKKITQKKEATKSVIKQAVEAKSLEKIKVQEEVVDRVGLSAWVVQLGSFSNEDNAQELNKKLRDAGYPAFVEPLKQKTSVVYRVRVGPELKRSDAQSLRDRLKNSMQLDGIVVGYP